MINAAIFWGRASFIKLGANKFIHKSFTQSVYTRHWFHCTCENPVSFGKTIVSNKNSWACLNARIRRPSIYTLRIISLYSVIPAISSLINGSYVYFSHTLVFIKNIVWLHVHMNRLKDFFFVVIYYTSSAYVRIFKMFFWLWIKNAFWLCTCKYEQKRMYT